MRFFFISAMRFFISGILFVPPSARRVAVAPMMMMDALLYARVSAHVDATLMHFSAERLATPKHLFLFSVAARCRNFIKIYFVVRGPESAYRQQRMSFSIDYIAAD